MIELNRLDDTKIIINSEQIESIEQTPDTVITLSNGKMIVVKDDAKQVLKKIINYKLEPLKKKLKANSFNLRSIVNI